jgi:hypothetical protein
VSLRPAAAAQPLHFWRAEQLDRLERFLEQVLRSWARDWGVAERALCVACHRASVHDGHAGEGTALRGEEGIVAWFRAGPWEAALSKQLFGEAVRPGGIAEEVARACVDDATRRLALALGISGAPSGRTVPSPGYRGAWGGQVRASLPFDGLLLMNSAAVGACLSEKQRTTSPPRSPAAIPVLQAATAHRLPLRAQLESCEIDLGVLQDLQPGDVLRIPHRLDAPLQVRTESGATLFRGYLASSRGRKVLELAAAT